MASFLGLITLAVATLLLRQEIASVVMPPLRSLFTSETPRPRTKIIQLHNSAAEAMALAVRAATRESPGLLVVPHVGTNSLVVQAPREDLERIVKWIAKAEGAVCR